MDIKITKKQVIKIFKEISILLELKGENPFKSRAYHKAIRVLEDLEQNLQQLFEQKALGEIKGIGKSTLAKLEELLGTGSLAYYEELKSLFPETLLDLLKVPGVGPKKVRVLYEKLSISSLEELEAACLEDKLLELSGFGAKTQEKILAGIEFIKRHQGRYLLNAAVEPAAMLLDFLNELPETQRVEMAGSIRRSRETIKDLDFVVATENATSVMKAFVEHPLVISVIAHGKTKSSVTLLSGLNVDLRTVSDIQFPYALMHFTGSKEHNTTMRVRAKQRGLKLNEYGLFRDDQLVTCKSEKEIFRALDLHFVPPELREDRGEFEVAEKQEFERLVQQSDLKGTFHAHTTYSDGQASLLEMAEAAMALGMEYLGISDHSRTASYAGGLSIRDVKRQFEEIDKLNQGFDGFCLFKGMESDILNDGSLDYPDEILQEFDFIIASVHSRFSMPEAEMTARVIKALENPFTTMLGHPTGRLLLSREAYAIDMHKVIDAAIANEVIIEINANPYRLDIDWRLLHSAKEKGLMLSINPDAHSTEALKYTHYGIGIARKGGLTALDVLNTRTLEQVKGFLQISD